MENQKTDENTRHVAYIEKIYKANRRSKENRKSKPNHKSNDHRKPKEIPRQIEIQGKSTVSGLHGKPVQGKSKT